MLPFFDIIYDLICQIRIHILVISVFSIGIIIFRKYGFLPSVIFILQSIVYCGVIYLLKLQEIAATYIISL